jgi:hypothetical protein
MPASPPISTARVCSSAKAFSSAATSPARPMRVLLTGKLTTLRSCRVCISAAITVQPGRGAAVTRDGTLRRLSKEHGPAEDNEI